MNKNRSTLDNKNARKTNSKTASCSNAPNRLENVFVNPVFNRTAKDEEKDTMTLNTMNFKDATDRPHHKQHYNSQM